MDNTLTEIKLRANEFIQEYERQVTERQYQKQKLKQNIMLEIMTNRHRSQASNSNGKDNSCISSNQSKNHSRAAALSEDKDMYERNSIHEFGRSFSEQDDVHRGAEVTFKAPKNGKSFILVEGQSEQPPEEESNNQSDVNEGDSTLRQQAKHESMTFRENKKSLSKLVEENQTQRSQKFKLAEPQIQPESMNSDNQDEENADQKQEQEKPGGVFLTMGQQESVDQQELKNYAFDIIMDKSEPIDNIEELRKKKIEELERKRQARMQEFKKSEEQKKLEDNKRSDSSLKGYKNQGYSRKSQTKISEDFQPEPPKPKSKKLIHDREPRANLSSQAIVQQQNNSMKPPLQVVQRSNYLISAVQKEKGENLDCLQTPKTINSESRQGKSRGKATIFKQSPKRQQKSTSKYSQQPKIEPKQRKNTFIKQSNKKLMITALSSVCLPGELNRKQRQRLTSVIQNDSSEFLVFLFKEYSRKVIKAIYTLQQCHSQVILIKIYGEKAPAQIRSENVSAFYRFDCGSKEFKKLDGCKSFSLVVHAIDLLH